MYLLITAIISAATVAAPTMKKKIRFALSYQKLVFILASLAYYFIYSALHVASMLLIMTYNGYVLLVIIFSMALSYAQLGSED
jgi:hypothetical protein